MTNPAAEGSGTPRTDFECTDSFAVVDGHVFVTAEFARELERDLTASRQREAELREAFNRCAKERRLLLEGIGHAEASLGDFRDKYFNEDVAEGCNRSEPYEAIQRLGAHLAGTAMDEEGNDMVMEEFDALLATPADAGKTGEGK